jgi:hypothetical protein
MPFKYPNLPKSVQNIVIDTKIVNETGNSKWYPCKPRQTFFQIDQDVLMLQDH